MSMATINGSHALYTHRLHAHGPDQYAADLDHGVGAHIPLHSTAIGKALLASLSQTEQKALVSILTIEPEGPNTHKTKKALIDELNQIRTRGIATCDEEQAWGSDRSPHTYPDQDDPDHSPSASPCPPADTPHKHSPRTTPPCSYAPPGTSNRPQTRTVAGQGSRPTRPRPRHRLRGRDPKTGPLPEHSQNNS